MNFRLFNFWGVWILSDSIFWDTWSETSVLVKEMLLCPLPQGEGGLRSAEYQLSQVIKSQNYPVHSKWQCHEISKFEAITAHISKINKVPL